MTIQNESVVNKMKVRDDLFVHRNNALLQLYLSLQKKMRKEV